jgi:predicted nucleic acid-binding protein
MRSGVLLDTGPLVAYLNPHDAYHAWAVEAFDRFDAALVTCEPVLTEACLLIARTRRPATLVLEYVTRGEVTIGLRVDEELAAVQTLMQRYADVPMSLADACLVRLTELTGLPVCTLDSDFTIYRARGRRPLELITPDRRSPREP